MAWRFKASKYKNAAPIVPKPELYVRDICVGSYQTYGNNITASAKFMAFNWDHVGSSLAVLPLDDCGRKSKLMPLLHAHSDTVTDMDFSPFHDGLLATGSQDCLVKIWHIPPEGLTESLSNAECTFSHKQRRVETVGFHPTADFLMNSTSYTTITLWDLISEKEIFSNSDHDDVVQSLSWKLDGSLFVTSCKDKQLRIFDPRSKTPCVKQADSHQSIKDSRVVWLGTKDKILSTGFDAQRLRQVVIRDVRMLNEPEKILELDCSTGILMPLYDGDTGMLFLAGKGDSTIGYMEVTDKEPYLIEGIRHSGEQTKGACLVPKRALNVMQGEVNRILQLTSSSVIPVTYQVPRKTYRDFHVDLFPETAGFKTDLTAQSWSEGVDMSVPTISLDPAKREKGEEPIVIHRGPLLQLRKEVNLKTVKQPPKPIKPVVKPEEPHPVRSIVKKIDNKDFEKKVEIEETVVDSKPVIEPNPYVPSKTVVETRDFLECETKEMMGEAETDKKPCFSEDKDKTCDLDSQKVPPKPLPRMSRTGSVSELGTEEGPKPVARPRHNSCAPVVTSVNPNNITGGYKPRLGPKPFTPPKLNDTENAFSKVFSVPAVPGSNTTNGCHEKPSLEEESAPPSLIEKTPSPEHTNNVNAENGLSLQVEDESDIPKTPSTSERRRLFEARQSSKEKDDQDNMDGNAFERASAQRNSIAERRRLYESQGLDNNNEKISSPVMLRRRDSFKNQKNTEDSTKEENNKKNTLLAKQQSLVETRKSEPIAPPQSKRTSTVFGVKSSLREPVKRGKSPNSVFRSIAAERAKQKPSGKSPKKHDSFIASPTTSPSKLKSISRSLLSALNPVTNDTGRVSKFRHLKGTTAHKSFHIENVRNLSRQIPGECDGFHANPERVAVPQSGAGGKIAVFELSKTGRLPDGVVPTLVHGCNIMDFSWDPFDNHRLAVACDDGMIKIWKIPTGGLTEPTNEPEKEFVGHQDKINFIKFHPSAKDVLASGSYDLTIKIWDLTSLTTKIILTGHTEHVFSFCWAAFSPYCATVCKDGKVRIYNPKKSEKPIIEGKGPEGSRGARLIWALEDRFIVVMGFDKVSERQITVYKASDLTQMNTVGLDVSPAILIPFYDEDSSTLFLTGKGDLTIYTFEITDEQPYICPLSHHKSNSLHQGLSFLPKNVCEVANVEFAKALRLTNNTIEPLSFTVPRIRSELFQDDLFPPTRVSWEPLYTSAEWFEGKDKKLVRVSLKPNDMESLSDNQPQKTVGINKSQSIPFISNKDTTNKMTWNTEQMKHKQDEIQKTMSNKLEINLKLEQDEMEGVDEKEWVD